MYTHVYQYISICTHIYIYIYTYLFFLIPDEDDKHLQHALKPPTQLGAMEPCDLSDR